MVVAEWKRKRAFVREAMGKACVSVGGKGGARCGVRASYTREMKEEELGGKAWAGLELSCHCHPSSLQRKCMCAKGRHKGSKEGKGMEEGGRGKVL